MKNKFYFLVASAIISSILWLAHPIFATEIVFKKKLGKTMEAKVIEITDKDIKIESTYSLDEIKSINGMTDISKTKIEELTKLGREYMEKEKCVEAIDVLKKVVEVDASNKDINKDFVEALKKCGRAQEAIPYISKKIEMDPNNADAWRILGSALRHIPAKEKEALAAFEKAIEIRGPDPANVYDLGVTHFCYGENDKALSYFEKVLTMKPAHHDDILYAYIFAGKCYLSLGRQQEAIAIFQKVIDFPVSERGERYRRQQGDAYYGLSLAYKALEQPAPAAEYEQKAKENGCISPKWYYCSPTHEWVFSSKECSASH